MNKQKQILNLDDLSPLMTEKGGTLISYDRQHFWLENDLQAQHPELPWRQLKNAHDGKTLIRLFSLPEEILSREFQDYLTAENEQSHPADLTAHRFYQEFEFYDDLLGDFPKLTVILPSSSTMNPPPRKPGFFARLFQKQC